MANWIKTLNGNAVNLDLCTKIIKVKNKDYIELVAFFPGITPEEIEPQWTIRSFDLKEESQADEFISDLTCNGYLYKSEAHQLAEQLA